MRSLVDRIELRPNQQGKLEIDLFGDLAGILTLAGKKDKPLDQNDQSLQQVKVVAGARNHLNLLFNAPRLEAPLSWRELASGARHNLLSG